MDVRQDRSRSSNTAHSLLRELNRCSDTANRKRSSHESEIITKCAAAKELLANIMKDELFSELHYIEELMRQRSKGATRAAMGDDERKADMWMESCHATLKMLTHPDSLTKMASTIRQLPPSAPELQQYANSVPSSILAEVRTPRAAHSHRGQTTASSSASLQAKAASPITGGRHTGHRIAWPTRTINGSPIGGIGGLRYNKVRAKAWPILAVINPAMCEPLPDLSMLVPGVLEDLRRETNPDGSGISLTPQELLLSPSHTDQNGHGRSYSDKYKGGVTCRLPSYLPEQTIYNDIQRSLWSLYPNDKEREEKRMVLKECLFRIIMSSAGEHLRKVETNSTLTIDSNVKRNSNGLAKIKYHYYQGLHEVLGHLLYVLQIDDSMTTESAMSICGAVVNKYFAPMCAPTLLQSELMLQVVHFIIHMERPALASVLDRCSMAPDTHYAVSWLLTWFSHDLDSSHPTLYFIYDLILASTSSHSNSSQDFDKGDVEKNQIGFHDQRGSSDEIILWCAAVMILFEPLIISKFKDICKEIGVDDDVNNENSGIDNYSLCFGMMFSFISKLPQMIKTTPLEWFLSAPHSTPREAADIGTGADCHQREHLLQRSKEQVSVYEIFLTVCELRAKYPSLFPLIEACEAEHNERKAQKDAHHSDSSTGKCWGHSTLAHRLQKVNSSVNKPGTSWGALYGLALKTTSVAFIVIAYATYTIRKEGLGSYWK